MEQGCILHKTENKAVLWPGVWTDELMEILHFKGLLSTDASVIERYKAAMYGYTPSILKDSTTKVLLANECSNIHFRLVEQIRASWGKVPASKYWIAMDNTENYINIDAVSKQTNPVHGIRRVVEDADLLGCIMISNSIYPPVAVVENEKFVDFGRANKVLFEEWFEKNPNCGVFFTGVYMYKNKMTFNEMDDDDSEG